MEQVLKKFTLAFFGKGNHKVSPAAFFELDDVVLLDVRSAIVYSFLLDKGFSDVCCLFGGYPALTDEAMPDKVLQLTLQEI